MKGLFNLARAAAVGMDGMNMEPQISITRDVSASMRMQVDFLEANLAKALLINEALWEIVRDKLKVTEEEFYNKIYEIDLRDGEVDGRNQRKVAECPQCKRKVASKHPTCLYCGAVIDESVFRMTR